MTFKSIDFFESPVMRSLEKIAVKNGLVKNDPLDKYAKAEKKFDLTPSKNLDENILKFCAALRKEGYEKLALEVEQNFVLYKQAESEYSKILNEAHPDGSHDLEGVLGDNEIEDLLAQHSKILNVVNKKPTGKTASSKDLINATKIALSINKSAAILPALWLWHKMKPLEQSIDINGNDVLEKLAILDSKYANDPVMSGSIKNAISKVNVLIQSFQNFNASETNSRDVKIINALESSCNMTKSALAAISTILTKQIKREERSVSEKITSYIYDSDVVKAQKSIISLLSTINQISVEINTAKEQQKQQIADTVGAISVEVKNLISSVNSALSETNKILSKEKSDFSSYQNTMSPESKQYVQNYIKFNQQISNALNKAIKTYEVALQEGNSSITPEQIFEGTGFFSSVNNVDSFQDIVAQKVIPTRQKYDSYWGSK